MQKNTTTKAFFALFVLTLIWGYNWVVMKLAVQYANPFQFAAIRTFSGAVILFMMMAFTKRALAAKELSTMLVLGLLQTVGFTGFVIWAVSLGGVGKAAVLSYTMPFWVMLLAWPLLGEKVQGWQWLAVTAALVGIVLIFDPMQIKADILSMVIALCSGVFWAISAIIVKKLHQRCPDLDLLNITAWPMLLGAIPLVIYALLLDAPPIQWTHTFIAAVLFNVVLSGVVAWLLWVYALQRLNAGIASMASMLAPVVGVVSAWLQLDEVPSQQELIGMGLVALALLIISGISIRKHQQI